MSDSDSDPEILSEFDKESQNIAAETPIQQRVSALRRSVGEVTAQRDLDDTIEELQERDANLARRLDYAGEGQTDARSVLLESSEMERAPEAAVMASRATPSSLPTVHGTAADMFKDQGPRDKSQLSNGTCPNPRDKR